MSFIASVVSSIGAPALATIGSSLIGAFSANKAANTQADAANRATELQKQMYDTSRADLAPYRESGYGALNKINSMTPYFTKQYGAEDFAADPSYQFRLQQGMGQTQGAANQAGGAIGGNALKALNDYSQGSASTEYGNAFNRFQTGRTNIYNTLANIAGMGQNSVNAGVNAGNTSATGMSNTMQNAGNAMAGGTVGASNAITGGLTNYANYNYLADLLHPQGGTPTPTNMTGFQNNNQSPAPWIGSSANSTQPFESLILKM
jgi:hypothetical protein